MEDPDLNVTCPVCKAGPRKPCRDLTFALLPGPHVERTETTPLADAVQAEVAAAAAEPKAYVGDDVVGGDFDGWSIRAYDDVALGGHTLRVVVTAPDGAVVREGTCETYKVWTVLAHWREGLPELAEAPWPQPGDAVVYRAHPDAEPEDGVCTGRSEDGTLAYVRYRDQHPGADGKATPVTMLERLVATHG